jgi:hypothetical protein
MMIRTLTMLAAVVTVGIGMIASSSQPARARKHCPKL